MSLQSLSDLLNKEIVKQKYPDATVATWADDGGNYKVVVTGNTVRGFGDDEDAAWKYAAEVIKREMG